MAERPLQDLIQSYLDSHLGETYNAEKIAYETGANKASIARTINIYFNHRLDPPTGKGKKVIIPVLDGRPNPVSQSESRGGLLDESSIVRVTQRYV